VWGFKLLENSFFVESERKIKNPVWKIFLLVLVIFVFSAFYGYFNGGRFQLIVETLKKIYWVETLKANPFLLMVFIFSNNAFKSFMVIPLGVFLTLPPIIFIVFNGFVVGLMAYEAVKRLGELGFIYFAAAILPHGVFELPAVFLSAALGIRVGLAVIARFRGENGVFLAWRDGLKTYFSRVLPILFIAAIIEAFITPKILQILFFTE